MHIANVWYGEDIPQLDVSKLVRVLGGKIEVQKTEPGRKNEPLACEQNNGSRLKGGCHSGRNCFGKRTYRSSNSGRFKGHVFRSRS